MLNVTLVKTIVASRGVFVEAYDDRPAKIVVTGNTKDLQVDLRNAGFKVKPVVGSNVIHVVS